MKQYVLLTVILLGVLFRLATLNIADLWVDEAKQFWRAKGIDMYEMDIQARPLQDTLRLNARQNFEPPLMCVFLHYWSKVNNSIPWLRLLSCLFGIAVLALMYLVARQSNFNKTWALAIVAFCSWCYNWVYYSSELKAYMFCIFCTTLTLYFILKVIKDNGEKTKNYFGLGLATSLGLFSVYGFWIFLPFISAVVLIFIFLNKNEYKKRIINTLLFFLPTLTAIIYILPQQLICQIINWKGHLWYIDYLSDYSGIDLFSKIISRTLLTISWQLFGTRDISLRTLPFLSMALILMLSLIFYLIRLTKQKKFEEVTVLTMFAYSVITCVFLSILGVYPIEPKRQSLFFSPPLVLSTFIYIKQVYIGAKIYTKGISKNICIYSLGMIMLMPNLYFNYHLDNKKDQDLRGLLKKIQRKVEGDNERICVYIYTISIPAFKYHYFYSDIPWFKELNKKDIFLGSAYKRESGPEGIERYFLDEIDKFSDFAKFNHCGNRWYIFSQIPERYIDKFKVLLTGEYNFVISSELKTRGTRAFKVESFSD